MLAVLVSLDSMLPEMLTLAFSKSLLREREILRTPTVFSLLSRVCSRNATVPLPTRLVMFTGSLVKMKVMLPFLSTRRRIVRVIARTRLSLVLRILLMAIKRLVEDLSVPWTRLCRSGLLRIREILFEVNGRPRSIPVFESLCRGVSLRKRLDRKLEFVEMLMIPYFMLCV